MRQFVAIFCLIGTMFVAGCSKKPAEMAGPYERMISYIGHNNKPVQIVLDLQTKTVTLRVKSGEAYISRDEDLRYLIDADFGEYRRTHEGDVLQVQWWAQGLGPVFAKWSKSNLQLPVLCSNGIHPGWHSPCSGN